MGSRGGWRTLLTGVTLGRVGGLTPLAAPAQRQAATARETAAAQVARPLLLPGRPLEQRPTLSQLQGPSATGSSPAPPGPRQRQEQEARRRSRRQQPGRPARPGLPAPAQRQQWWRQQAAAQPILLWPGRRCARCCQTGSSAPSRQWRPHPSSRTRRWSSSSRNSRNSSTQCRLTAIGVASH